MEINRELNSTEIESKKKSYNAPVLEEIGSVGEQTMGATEGTLTDNTQYYSNAPSQPAPPN